MAARPTGRRPSLSPARQLRAVLDRAPARGAGLNPDLHQNNNNTSVRVGPDWKPTENLLLYLTFSQGYRGAAFNGQAFNAPAELNFAQPEKLNSYELGLKDQFWNQRGIFNAAAFYYDYKNQQFLDSFALPPEGRHRLPHGERAEIEGVWRGIRADPARHR